MQAYFDRDDADLEYGTIVGKEASNTDAPGGILDAVLNRRNAVYAFVTTVGLTVMALFVVGYFGSVPWSAQAIAQTPEINTRFIIELPKPQPQKPKPIVKPIIKPAETRPVERLRSIPDKSTQVLRPKMQLSGRTTSRDAQRVSQQEAAAERSLPATIAPVVAEVDEFAQRDYVQEQSDRSTTTSLRTDRVREPVGEATTRNNRAVADAGVSRIQLDPYHYQMVNICLRQCVRSMFMHTGMDEMEQAYSKEWLKVTRAADNYFEFRFGGRWVRLHVNVNSLGDISNIDFVRMPGDWGDAESLLEEATRKLCHLLRYDDCFAKL